MGNILYLAHRLPYPPNKGDKVRSYHLLKHLAARHKVFLGTLIDDPDDERHVETVRGLCVGLHAARLNPCWAKARSLGGLFSDEALELPYYRDGGLQAWVDRIRREGAIDAIVVFSSVMAQYIAPAHDIPFLIDFVDVDSAKWTQYALVHPWPMSWLYRREGRRLLEFERAVAARATHSFFVTENETALFRRLAPECASNVGTMCNGVDADYFSPSGEFESPFGRGEMPIVFTGTMDYWPNIDAVTWFATEVLPVLRATNSKLRFWIVGRSPGTQVRALAGEAVSVSGTVPDIRPYLQHAAVVVAPLRVARGIQNKILEAMAMARPVVASSSCVGAIDADIGRDLLVAESVEDFVHSISALLDNPERGRSIGASARRRVLDRYKWDAHMSGIDRYLTRGATA